MRYSPRTSSVATVRRAAPTGNTAPATLISMRYSFQRRGRFWEVLDASGELVCLTVYKRGAEEVIRRLRI